MFKLVVIGGKLRGEEFVLQEGDNTLGRSDGVTIVVPINGVSKKHCNINVTKNSAYIEDLNSSNGTFLNGLMIKRATLQSGDKIALPDIIFQIVHVEEKKKIIKKKIAKTEEVNDEDLDKVPLPTNTLGRLLHYFKHRLMQFLYGINKDYEWKILVAIVLTIFILLSIAVTLFPVIQDSRLILQYETAKRGSHYAEEIARINAKALESKNLNQVDTNFLNSEPDVIYYELYDLEGRIVRPLTKINEYISDPFSIQAREWVINNKKDDSNVFMKFLGNSELGIAKKIVAYNSKIGVFEPVGIIAIRFAPQTLAIETTKNSKAFLEAFISVGLIAIFVFGIFYYLTLRPIEEIRGQLEMGLRGKRRNLETSYMMKELSPLVSSINTLLQRLRDLQRSEGDENVEEEDATPYLMLMGELSKGAAGPILLLSSEKTVHKINVQAEDLLGIRESVSQNQSIIDVVKEKGFASVMIEICDNSFNAGGVTQEGSYELKGYSYTIFSTAIVGKDNFAKGFYISFVKDEN